jgi:hypothetical protein
MTDCETVKLFGIFFCRSRHPVISGCTVQINNPYRFIPIKKFPVFRDKETIQLVASPYLFQHLIFRQTGDTLAPGEPYQQLRDNQL